MYGKNAHTFLSASSVYFCHSCIIFPRYAASGGHNAILHLLLLQPGIDINTPDWLAYKKPFDCMIDL